MDFDLQHSPQMLKEIFEQPFAMLNTTAFYQELRNEASLHRALEVLKARKRLIIAATGSSRHAGMVASFMLSKLAEFDVRVVSSNEYENLSGDLRKQASLLVISQSGETTDTLRALRLARAERCPTVALTNVPGSSMCLEADEALAVNAGKEFAIPATKSFTGQLLVLLLLATATPSADNGPLKDKIRSLPGEMALLLPNWHDRTLELATLFADKRSFYFLGSGIHAGIAAEGALKLKETALRHAEFCNTGEVEHGPNAIIADCMPIFLVSSDDPCSREQQVSYRSEVRLADRLVRQGGQIVQIGNGSNDTPSSRMNERISFREDSPYLQVFLETIPLQLFAYHSAALHGISMDRPPNLSKAVIVGDQI
jgi:glutamine---fructose-6-phosphate transaminase (isomerizing)